MLDILYVADEHFLVQSLRSKVRGSDFSLMLCRIWLAAATLLSSDAVAQVRRPKPRRPGQLCITKPLRWQHAKAVSHESHFFDPHPGPLSRLS